MLLSSLGDETDAALFGAVVAGDLVDDGEPVECEVLAMALELWRLTGSVEGVHAGLEAWRCGEPWEEWLDAAVEGWLDVRPRVLRGFRAIDALALVGEAMRAEVKALAGMERALQRHALARIAGERAARMMREVLRG